MTYPCRGTKDNDLSGAATGIFRNGKVITVADDAMALCFARSSSAMALANHKLNDKDSIYLRRIDTEKWYFFLNKVGTTRVNTEKALRGFCHYGIVKGKDYMSLNRDCCIDLRETWNNASKGYANFQSDESPCDVSSSTLQNILWSTKQHSISFVYVVKIILKKSVPNLFPP